MRIKDKELRRKCQPCLENMQHRIHNQEMLLEERDRRRYWRIEVLYACDNFRETFKGIGFDLDRIIFPSHRRVNKRIGTWGYMVTPDRNKYHIIRHGKDKWRIVKAKLKGNNQRLERP